MGNTDWPYLWAIRLGYYSRHHYSQALTVSMGNIDWQYRSAISMGYADKDIILGIIILRRWTVPMGNIDWQYRLAIPMGYTHRYVISPFQGWNVCRFCSGRVKL